MPRAATIGRIAFSPSMARRKPPTSPDDVLGRDPHAVEQELAGVDPPDAHLRSMPPTDTPGRERSTMKQVMLSWARESGAPVLANTQYQSAWRTPDIQHFEPVITQSSPSGTARVRIPMTSLPAWGSESPKAARWAPVATGVT